MPNLKAYQEAHRRGLLQGNQLAGYEEYQRRGLAGPPQSAITGQPVPTQEERFAPVKAIAGGLRATDRYLRGNVQDRQSARDILPKWYTRERGDGGIYAEPPLDLGLMVEDAALGPLKLVGKGEKLLKGGFKQLARGAKPVRAKSPTGSTHSDYYTERNRYYKEQSGGTDTADDVYRGDLSEYAQDKGIGLHVVEFPDRLLVERLDIPGHLKPQGASVLRRVVKESRKYNKPIVGDMTNAALKKSLEGRGGKKVSSDMADMQINVGSTKFQQPARGAKPVKAPQAVSGYKVKTDAVVEQPGDFPTWHGFTFTEGPAKGASFTVLKKSGMPTAEDIRKSGQKILDLRK